MKLGLIKSLKGLTRRVLICLASTFFYITGAEANCIGDQQSTAIYSVSVVPQIPPSEIFSVWSVLLDRIGKNTGLCFTLVLQSNIQDFEARLLTGEPDFSWVNPYHAVMAHKKLGYIPLLRDRKLLSGLLITRKDSPVQSLQMLKDARIAFPSPNSFAASLLIRATLDQDHIPIKPVYVKTHSNVYRATLIEDVKAGGGVNNTFAREPVSLQKELKVLYETPAYAPHPVIVNPRVSELHQQAFTHAFLALAKDPEMSLLLNKIPMPAPVLADYRRDYFPLESLGLEKYVVVGSD